MVCLVVEFLEFLEFFEFSEFFGIFGIFGIGVFSCGMFGIETVTYAVVFWNILFLWNFVIF